MKRSLCNSGPRGLLSRITTDAGTYRLSRDPRGLIAQLQHPYGQWQQQYAAAGQLTHARHDSDDYTYRYDPAGNRTAQNLRHDDANRLLEDADHQYRYDTRGNLIRKTHKASGAYTTYRYDPLGRRVEKTVDGQLTSYLWLGDRLIAEYQDGQQTRTYTYGEGYAPIAVGDGTGTYIVHSDHLDTPRQLSDASGRIVWQNRPTPYGIGRIDEDPDGDGTAITFNLRFPGQYHDAESGLHYNYFRYYDPGTGRYITSDPIGLGGGFNTYVYGYNNLIIYIDPFGLYCIFNPVGTPSFRPTNERNRIVTDSGESTFFFPVPVPSTPGPGDYPGRGGRMPMPGFGLLGQTTYWEEGYFERKYIGKQWGVLRCYDDCGNLTDETWGFKDTVTEWKHDGDFRDEWQGPVFGPITSPANPNDLPPIGRR